MIARYNLFFLLKHHFHLLFVFLGDDHAGIATQRNNGNTVFMVLDIWRRTDKVLTLSSCDNHQGKELLLAVEQSNGRK